MADQDRLPRQRREHVGVVINDLPDRLVGEHLGMGVSLLDSLRVVWPAGLDRGVASVVQRLRPPVPAAWKEPETMREDCWGQAARVCVGDLFIDGASSGYRHEFLLAPPQNGARLADFAFAERRCLSPLLY